MFAKHFHFRPLVLAVAVASVMMTACVSHAGVEYYRVYDPFYSDYHVWGPPEIDYYNTWIIETHRPHREFRELPREEQREYFTWRHARPQRH